MAIEEQVLNKILEYGMQKKYFKFVTIGELDKSCCQQSKVEIIDFDATKEKIVAEFKFGTLKSCDALKITNKNKCIDFIELKSSINILKNPKNNSDAQIKEQVSKFDFQGKIRDSLLILSNIISKRDNMLSGNEQSIYYEIRKNYIILTDISPDDNPLEFISFTLDFLGELSSSLMILLKDKIDNINPGQLHNLQKPVLMDCKSFEKHYGY